MVVTEVLAIVLWSLTEAVPVRLQFSLLESSWVCCYHASQGHFPCVTGSSVLSCLRFLEEAPYLFLNVFHGSPTHFLSNFFLNNIYLLFNMCVCMYMVCAHAYIVVHCWVRDSGEMWINLYLPKMGSWWQTKGMIPPESSLVTQWIFIWILTGVY